MVKRTMCHMRLTGLFLAILACLSILYAPSAQAQAAGIEARFVVDWAAPGETAGPRVEVLMAGNAGSGHYAFIIRGRPIKIIGKN
jgi:hypothetical protein